MDAANCRVWSGAMSKHRHDHATHFIIILIFVSLLVAATTEAIHVSTALFGLAAVSYIVVNTALDIRRRTFRAGQFIEHVSVSVFAMVIALVAI